jgi:hypothetical protein
MTLTWAHFVFHSSGDLLSTCPTPGSMTSIMFVTTSDKECQTRSAHSIVHRLTTVSATVISCRYCRGREFETSIILP